MRRLLLGLAACALLYGCATDKHYKITDTATDDEFYTRAYEDEDKDGVIQFVNPFDGQRVQLQDPEIVEITKEEYHSTVYGQ